MLIAYMQCCIRAKETAKDLQNIITLGKNIDLKCHLKSWNPPFLAQLNIKKMPVFVASLLLSE